MTRLATSVPKPKRPAKRKRAWNSTLPTPSAAKASPKRNSVSHPTRSAKRDVRKPLKKVNVERERKRRALYKKKLEAYRRSETYKIVEQRAAGRCEERRHVTTVDDVFTGMWGMPAQEIIGFLRCAVTRAMGAKLTHHHKTYRRFGGAERPDDIIVLCDRHNAEAESKHPTRWHQRRAS